MFKYITVYSHDNNGIYVGECEAHEFEQVPGTYNIPYNAVKVKPEVEPGYQYRWTSPHSEYSPLRQLEGTWVKEPKSITLYQVDEKGFLIGPVETFATIVGEQFERLPQQYVLAKPPEEFKNTFLRWASPFEQSHAKYGIKGEWVRLFSKE